MRHLFLIVLSCFIVYGYAWRIKLVPESLDNRKTGHNIFASCEVRQNASESPDDLPKFTFKWTKMSGDQETDVPLGGGHMFARMSGAKLHLTFMDATLDDSGIYKCYVTDPDGVTQTATQPLVLIQSVEVVDCAEKQHPIDGSDARLTCLLSWGPENPPTIEWFKNDQRIKQGGSRGYAFEKNGTVLVIPGYKATADDGAYKVQIISEKAGEFDVRHIQAASFLQPVMVKWETEVEVNERQSKQLYCSATGRPAPTYTWFKGGADGVELSSSAKYEIAGGELMINALTDNDRGLYTCRAANTVGRAHAAVQVDVFLQPRIGAVSNASKVVGERAELRCEFAGGEPMAASWVTRGRYIKPRPPQDEDAPEDEHANDSDTFEQPQEEEEHMYALLEEKDGVSVLSLIINDLQVEDANEYQCQVVNNAGAVSKRIFLSVNHEPILYSSSSEVIRSFGGHTAQMFCEVEAVPPPAWTWTRSGQTLQNVDDVITIVNSDNRLKSTLRVVTSSEENYGEYMCMADNTFGTPVEVRFNVIEIFAPPPPENMRIDAEFPTWAEILIDDYESLPVSRTPTNITFHIRQKTAEEEETPEGETEGPFDSILSWNDVPTVTLNYNKESNVYVLNRLTPETSYAIRAEATNEAGGSKLSEQTLHYVTSKALPPAMPNFVTENNSKCEQVCKIQWAGETMRDHGAAITGYKLQYYQVDMSASGEPKRVGQIHVLALQSHEWSTLVRDLAPLSVYEFRLHAVNSIGQGAEAELIIRTTDFDVLSGGVSAGVVALIVVVVLLALLVLLDVACYHVYHCGVLMTVCVNCCGKPPPDSKAREIALEEGKRSEDKEPLKEQQVPVHEEEVKPENGAYDSTTPMIDSEKEPPKKDTTV